MDFNKCCVVGVYKEYVPTPPSNDPPGNPDDPGDPDDPPGDPDDPPGDPDDPDDLDNPPPPDGKLTKEIVKYRSTGGMGVNPDSWSVENPSTLSTRAGSTGAVTTDTDYSNQPDKEGTLYDAQTSIPTTEHLKTNATVPKYLIDIDFLKSTYSKKYEVYCYQFLNGVAEYTDGYGNQVTIYYGVEQGDVQPVVRSNHHYSLKGANIFVPDNISIKNDALAAVVNETTISNVATMFAKNGSIKEPVIVAGEDDKKAKFAVPKYDEEALKIDYGLITEDVPIDVSKIAADQTMDKFIDNEATKWIGSNNGNWSTESEKHAQAADAKIDPILATNQEVVFYPEGTESKRATVLLLHEDLTTLVAEPKEPELAGSVGDDVFSSKNPVPTDMPETEKMLYVDADVWFNVRANSTTDIFLPAIVEFIDS